MGPAGSDGGRSTPRLADIDLAGVAEALGDNSAETTWWYDPSNGQVEMTVPDDLQGLSARRRSALGAHSSSRGSTRAATSSSATW